MTRFTDRVERDLSQISDHATPSSTAWEAIQHRIGEQDTHSNSESTMEVIMLAPDTNKLSKRPRTPLLLAAAAAAVALIGGLIVVSSRDGAPEPTDRPEPTPTVPATDPAVSGDPTPVAVDPELAPSTDAAAVPAPDGDALPPVPSQTTGEVTAVCSFGEFVQDGEVSALAPQTCAFEGEPLPVQTQQRIQVTLFFNDTPTGGEGSNSFVSTSDDDMLTAGYNYNNNESVYVIGLAPGVGEYEGETVHFLMRSDDDINAIVDWTIEPSTSPLPTAEEGGISAEVTVECTPTIVETIGDSLIVDQACTYAGDDSRFVPAPEVLQTTLRTVDGNPYADQRPVFVTAHGDGDRIVSGIAEDSFAIRAVGVRPGTGEFEGMPIHDVIHFTSDADGNLTGTMRSTVWPDEA
jgi:hypothetical protein